MADEDSVPGVPSDEGSSPSDQPQAAPELGSQAAPELGAQGQAAPPLTVEQLAEQIKTLEKRFGDTQAALHAEKARSASLESRASQFSPFRQQQAPQQQFDPFGGPAPTFDPMAGQQPDLSQVALAMAADSHVALKMMEVEKELGFPVSDGEKQAIHEHLQRIGSADVKAAARLLLHDRIVEHARESGKAEASKAIKESHKGVVQQPSGQTGQPKRVYESYAELFSDLERQGKL
jgi:hypothetical protein